MKLNFKTLSCLFAALVFLAGCLKEVEPDLGEPSDGERSEVSIHIGMDGGDTKATINENAISSMCMYVFVGSQLDFKSEFTSSEIAAMEKTVKLHSGPNTICVLANCSLLNVNTLVDFNNSVISFSDAVPMWCRSDVDVPSGNGIAVLLDPDGFKLKRLYSKVVLGTVTNSFLYPYDHSALTVVGAYLANVVTRSLPGGYLPADPRYIHQEGLRNHGTSMNPSEVIGHAAPNVSYIKTEAADNFYNSAYLEGLKAQGSGLSTMDRMDYYTWCENRVDELCNGFATSTVSAGNGWETYEYTPSGPGIGGGGGIPGRLDVSFTYSEGYARPKCDYLMYPDPSLVSNRYPYPYKQSSLHFISNTYVSHGSTATINKALYCFPNPATRPNHGFNMTFDSSVSTTLVLVIDYDGKRNWYPVPLTGGLLPNKVYTVNAVIKYPGNSYIDPFDELPDHSDISDFNLSIVVSDWVTKATYDETL